MSSTKSGPVGIGIIGAGDISGQYLESLTSYPDTQVLSVADLDLSRAAAQAAKYKVPHSGSVAELLANPDIEIVVNITIPAAHAEVSQAIIAAGKNVWTEKPITVDRPSAQAMLVAAKRKGVLVGGAPDTILGEAIQTAKRRLDGGSIGKPQTVLTLMQGPGPDAWHPRPQFLFAKGAGPLFDIGPYYFATLGQLLGSIESVQALGHTTWTTRTIGKGPEAGQTFPVEVPTHVSVITRFTSGVVGTSIYSFETPSHRQLFEITGETGVLEVPVSGFDGPTRILAAGGDGANWTTIPAEGHARVRGAGVLEMARALRAGKAPRASGDLAFHVLDAMLAVEESIASGRPVAVQSRVPIVEALPADWDPRQRTL